MSTLQAKRAGRTPRSLLGSLPPHPKPPAHDPPGQVYTPPAWAAWLATYTWQAWAEQAPPPRPRRVRVYDPAVGDGALLKAADELLRAHGAPVRLLGMELQPVAAARARRSLDADITCGNSLLDEHPTASAFDLILANPPYLGARHVTTLPYVAALRDKYGRRTDLFAYFLVRILKQLHPGGVAGVLVPDTWTTLPGYEWLRRQLLGLDLSLVALLPARVFDRTVHPSALVVRNAPAQKGAAFTLLNLRDSPAADLHAPHDRAIRMTPEDILRFPRAVIAVPTRAQAAVHAVHGPRLARWIAQARRIKAEHLHLRPGRVVPLAAILRIKDCGIHTRNCRHRLIHTARDHRPLPRLVQGRNVTAYQVRWGPPHAPGLFVDIHYCPRPGVPGRGRAGRPSRRTEYWNWQGPPEIHLRPRRILIRQTDDDLVAGLIENPPEPTYTDNTLFTGLLTESARAAGLTYEYLLAYLNAPSTNRVYQYLSQERGRSQAQVKIGNLRWLPFRVPSLDLARRVSRDARRLIDALACADAPTAARLRPRLDAHFADM